MAIHWQDYIEERKDVMMAKPVFKGTRLTVEHILKEMTSSTSAPSEAADTRMMHRSTSTRK